MEPLMCYVCKEAVATIDDCEVSIFPLCDRCNEKRKAENK